MIKIVRDEVELTSVIESVKSPLAGALVLFLGVTREFTNELQTASLEYDGYAAMAEKKLQELESEARRRWAIVNCSMVHRLGILKLEEVSVAIAVSSVHRNDALAAATWLIDTLKQAVPIWKKENWANGTSQWVHPGWTQTKS